MSIDFRTAAQDSISIAITPRRLYSARQTAVGTFFGGPIGLAYFLRSNYASLGNRRGQTLALASGMFLTAILAGLVLLAVYSSGTAGAVIQRISMPVNLASVVIARYVAQRQIASSQYYDFHSNLRVFGAAVVCLLCSALAIFGTVFVFVFAAPLDSGM
jgi:hypothetical protein